MKKVNDHCLNYDESLLDIINDLCRTYICRILPELDINGVMYEIV